MNTIFDAEIFAIFTENRFNQVLLFSSWNNAADWCRKATTWTEEQIAKNIKTARRNGGNYLDLFDT